MANLLYKSKLNAALEEIIQEAESYILLMCPYFKLHDRVKDCLKSKMDNPHVQIIAVFGKNEEDRSKSLHKEDCEFLKSFPNVMIRYEKRLHAKYYANEKAGLITSLNLHTFSLDNNIEAGVFFSHKGILKSLTDRAFNPLTSIISDTEDIATEANDFFDKVLENAEQVFEKQPKFESKLLGFQKTFVGSDVILDNTSKFFLQHTNENKRPYSQTQDFKANSNQQQNFYRKSSYSFHRENSNYSQPVNRDFGFCIRTREEIPFEPSRPLSRSAYHTWAEFGNPDYREKFCHSCGNNWGVSVRKPLCNNCEG